MSWGQVGGGVELDAEPVCVWEPPDDAFMASLEPPAPSEFDAESDPGRVVDWLLRNGPGVDALGALVDLDASVLTDRSRLDAALVAQRVESLAAALKFRFLAALPDPSVPAGVTVSESPATAEQDWIRESVATTLGVSTGSAAVTLSLARDVNGRLARTGRALRRGHISTAKAGIIHRSLSCVPWVDARAIEADVLPDAPVLSHRRIENRIKKHVATLQPDAAAEAAASERVNRHVTLEPAEHDMAWLHLYGPAEDIASIYAYCDRVARAPRAPRESGAPRAGVNDSRHRPARRFDALANLAVQALAGDLPGVDLPPMLTAASRNHGPAVQVTVALTTLLGLDDMPADLTGHGPITAGTARRIAADPTATWRRLLTDPVSGTCLDYGRTKHQPPPDLRDHVIARDKTCVFPNCDRPAHTSHLDHTRAWDDNGETSAGNLAVLCVRHHRLKHDTDWTYRPDPNDRGAYEWTDPDGRTYQRDPHRYDTTPTAPTQRALHEDADDPPF